MDSPWKVFGARPLIGQVGYDWASVRRRVRWRSLFRYVMDVSLIDDHGTYLLCRPGQHPLAALLSTGWFGFLMTAAGLFAVFAIAGDLVQRYWLLVAVPGGMLGSAAVALYLGKGDTSEDHAFLIGQLARMTDAEAA